jgi:hypothetical protein
VVRSNPMEGIKHDFRGSRLNFGWKDACEDGPEVYAVQLGDDILQHLRWIHCLEPVDLHHLPQLVLRWHKQGHQHQHMLVCVCGPMCCDAPQVHARRGSAKVTSGKLACLHRVRWQHLDHAAHAPGLGRAAEATLGLHGGRPVLPWSRLPSRPRAAVLPRRCLLLAAILAGLAMHLLLTRVLARGRLLLPRVLPRRRLLAGVLAGRRLLPRVLTMLAGGRLARVASGRLARIAARSLARVPAGRLAWVAARAGGTVAWLACRSSAVGSVRKRR